MELVDWGREGSRAHEGGWKGMVFALLPYHLLVLFFHLMRTCHASLTPGETELDKVEWGEYEKYKRISRFLRGEREANSILNKPTKK